MWYIPKTTIRPLLLQNLNNLITVVAVSSDSDARIVYSQVMRGVPSDSLFSVSNTGVVNVIGNIDREAEPTYDVQIEVASLNPTVVAITSSCHYIGLLCQYWNTK